MKLFFLIYNKIKYLQLQYNNHFSSVFFFSSYVISCHFEITFSLYNFYKHDEIDDNNNDFDQSNPDKNFSFVGSCDYINSLDQLKTYEPEISVMNFNIRSIKMNFESFTNLLTSSKVKIDIITLTESWLDEDSCVDDYCLEGYHSPITQNRKGRSGGGVIIYISTKFEMYKERVDLSYSNSYNNILTAELSQNKKKYCISVCYRSPSAENYCFLDSFNEMISKVKKYNAIITGDFNYNLFNVFLKVFNI